MTRHEMRERARYITRSDGERIELSDVAREFAERYQADAGRELTPEAVRATLARLTDQ